MSGNQERYQEAMKNGHSAAWDQTWDRAAEYYRQALEEFPEDPAALTDLGLAYYQMQNYKEAVAYYEQAVQVLPNDVLPLEKVAELNEKLGNLRQAAEVYWQAAELSARNRDMDKAIANWSRVIRLMPEHLMAHSRLALVYERLGRKQQSVMEYLALASLLQHSGEVQKAIQTVNHALIVASDSKEAAQALELLRTGQRLPKPVRPGGQTGPLITTAPRQLVTPKEIASTKSSLDPVTDARQRAIAFLAGQLFEEPDEESEASSAGGVKGFVQGITGGREANRQKIFIHLSQAVDLQTRDQDAGAVNALQQAVNTGLDEIPAYYDLGLLLSGSEQAENAIPYLQKSVANAEYALASRLLMGKAYRAAGQLKDAAMEFLQALALADSQMVSKDRAEDLLQSYAPLLQSLELRSEDYHQNICANVSDMLNKPNWSELLLRARQQLPAQPAGAPPLPIAEILTEAHGGQVVESITKIHQLARSGYHRAAMEEAFYALEYAPTYLPLHTYIGELLLQQGHTQNAVDKFNTVAQAFAVRGESRRAVEVFHRVVELSPMDMGVRNRLIDELVSVGDAEAAIREYLNLADVYYSLADLINARKTYTLALRQAQQSNVDKGWRVKVLHRMADIDLQSLDWRQAMRLFEQIRTIQPDDEKARISLVELNFRLGQTSQAFVELDSFIDYLIKSNARARAIKILGSMVEENPRQPLMRRRLAELFRQDGRDKEAIEQLDTAGDMQLKSGDRSGAIETLMAILALNPPNAAEYQRVLARIKEAR